MRFSSFRRVGVTGCIVAATALFLAVGALRPHWAFADVTNGGFETPAVDGLVTYSAPSAFGGWSVEAGSVRQADSSQWAPAGGAQSIALGQAAVRAASAVSQIVAVEPGHRYRLSFRYADGPTAPVGFTSCGSIDGLVMPITVSWEGEKIATVRWSGGHLTDDWQHFSTLVTATAGSAALRFGSAIENDAQECFMNLDDVAVGTPTAAETATSLSSSPTATVSGQPVTLTATVISGDVGTVPTGSVQFAVDGTPIGSSAVEALTGHAALGPITPPVGTHVITATYQPAGGTSFQTSHAEPLTLTVSKADTVTGVKVSPDPTVAGQDAMLSATVSAAAPGGGTPTGTVQFTESDGTPIGSPQTLVNGEASLAASASAGTYTVRANYSGSEQFFASSGSIGQTVGRAGTTTSVSSDRNPVVAGGEVTFTVSVTTVAPGRVQPAGTIAIVIDGVDVSGPVPLFDDGPTASAVAVTFTAPTAPRTYAIQATYSGDEDTNTSSSPTFLQTVAALAGTGQSGPTPAHPTAGAPTEATLGAMTAPLRRKLKRKGLAALKGAREVLTVNVPGTLKQTVYTPRAPRAALTSKAKAVLIASGKRKFAAAGTGTLRLRLTPAGRRTIRRAPRRTKSTRVAIVTRFVPAIGPPVLVVQRLTGKPRSGRSARLAASHGGWQVAHLRGPARGCGTQECPYRAIGALPRAGARGAAPQGP
jgi:hypothetical protein